MDNKQRKQANRRSSDRLIGWLVSYELDESGFSYKITTGKTFIAKDDTADVRTLAINDDTINSPHLVLKATDQHTIFALDIFSDNGSFLQRGNEQERPISGPVKLKHGDWIRVGDNTRFQVCLIDGQTK